MTLNKTYRISLAGDLGSGKSTVGKLLSSMLGIEKFTVGTAQRELAEKMNMTPVELNRYMEDKPEMDKVFDDWQRKFEDRDGSFILDSRLGFFFVPSTFGVYLRIGVEESARRIMNAERSEERYDSLADAVAKITERRASERARFIKFYGVDIMDEDNYDLIVDTANKTPAEVADIIIAAYKDKRAEKLGEEDKA